MKKLLALVLTLGLLLALCAPAAAADAVVMASSQSLELDGKAVTCEKYNIDGNNFFKLRDLAQLLNGTGSQFDVGWDEEMGLVSISTRHAYLRPDGHELEQRGDLSATAIKSAQTVEIDGVVRDDLIAWNIGGSNFFMLRELGRAIGFTVDYTPATNTAVVGSLPELPGVQLIPMGGTGFADLDGDGVINIVRLRQERNESGWFEPYLTIDGKDYTEAMYEAREGNHFDAVDDFWWAITDLDGSDGLLEIAVQDWGPSDDPITVFFRFDGKALSYLGAPEGFLFYQTGPGPMTLNGDGTLRSQLRLDVFQTWWAMVTYAPGDDGTYAPLPQDFYASTYPDQQVTLLWDLYGYDAPGGTKRVLPAGTEAQVVGTDNAHWVKLLVDGKDAWLYLPNGFELEAPEGGCYGAEAMTGLNMAD